MDLDILILGNGAIGMLTAMKVKQEFPNRKVGIIGDPMRKDSASVAAGAMCNVFAEIEMPFSSAHKQLMELSLWYGISGREGWLDLFSTQPEFKKVKTSSNTLVFLKEHSSDFETSNFNKSRNTAESYGVAMGVDSVLLKKVFENASQLPADAFQIEGEFAIDSSLLFFFLHKVCADLGVTLVEDTITGIDLIDSQVNTLTSQFGFNKLIVALGSNSSLFLPEGTIQNIVQGVGTAFEISKNGIDGFLAEKRYVIRTVNRGGAQCGFHFVPRNEGFYLGAGNYIMSTGKSDHRLETLRYLFNTFEKEVCGSDISYRLEGNLVKGHRPRAMDGFPLIGHLRGYENIFVASGTNRAGFTWAPKIANQVVAWCNGNDYNSPFESLTSPNRREIDFGSEEEAIRYYTESRISAALEHGKIQPLISAVKSEELRIANYARKLLTDVRHVKRNSDIVPHPDHWAVILEQESAYNV